MGSVAEIIDSMHQVKKRSSGRFFLVRSITEFVRPMSSDGLWARENAEESRVETAGG